MTEDTKTKPRQAKRTAGAVPPRPAESARALLERGATFDRAELGAYLNKSQQGTYHLEKDDPDFPQPLYFGASPRWLVVEIIAWIEAQADKRSSARRAAAAAAKTETAA